MTSQQVENPQSPGQNTGGLTKPGQRPKRSPPKPLRPYKVILHNDDVNDIGYVVKTVQKIAALSAEDAVQRAQEAHEAGLSLLLSTHRERAELYQEQFTSAGLTVTIEPG